jgi:hypothetical protein
LAYREYFAFLTVLEFRSPGAGGPGQNTPNSSALKRIALQSSKLDTLRNLSNMEILSYTSCESRQSSSRFSRFSLMTDK